MSRSQQQIEFDIDSIAPPMEDWGKLDSLLQEMWRDGMPRVGIPALLRVFERYPVEEDGCGVFWSIVHGVEALSGYEADLVCSVSVRPSEFGVLMVGRLLNAGITKVGTTDLLGLLGGVAEKKDIPKRVQEVAARFRTKRAIQ